MLESLDNNILYRIFYFIFNEEIFKIRLYNKYFLNIIDKNKEFKRNIQIRDHPTVFNCVGNYCKICNFNKKINFNHFTGCYHPPFF